MNFAENIVGKSNLNRSGTINIPENNKKSDETYEISELGDNFSNMMKTNPNQKNNINNNYNNSENKNLLDKKPEENKDPKNTLK